MHELSESTVVITGAAHGIGRALALGFLADGARVVLCGAESALTLEQSAQRVQEMHDAAKRIRPDILVLCHGGPIAEPEDAQFIFDNTEGIAGFFGASSIERLSVEPALESQTRSFKALKL